ncbi:unnamed protein product [Lymnaea stagnalis]|uniref:Mitochondrial fission factor n=1 Tax=Lymnaea stagnalis TaxID=6523 RepID=A0AAV2HRX1_LYMST
MSDMQDDPIKLPDHTQPSDYSDVQPKSYDPEFISQISSKMQVPDRISLGSDYSNGRENGYVNSEISAATNFVRMTVPDRIILAGDNQHIAMRQDLELDLPANVHKISDMSYVGLITPPRTLTLEERFPIVEETDDQKMLAGQGGVNRSHMTANGHLVGPVPYDPGVNLNDSVLLNEENEATLLRTQVAKLTRRVQVIEQDNQRRASRELVMYPVILGYFLWKILGWLTRDR